jgi:hypothetical protein
MSNEHLLTEAAAKKVAKPLWVIAICTAVWTTILLIAIAYAGVTYVRLVQAFSEISGTESSQTTDPSSPDYDPNCETDGSGEAC